MKMNQGTSTVLEKVIKMAYGFFRNEDVNDITSYTSKYSSVTTSY